MQKLEKLYCSLLDKGYQETLFGDSPNFEKKGDGYIADCPFHDDVLPSMLISQNMPSYFCFICSMKGDWIDYLMRACKLSFEEALARLEAAAGFKTGLQEDEWMAEHTRSQLLELVYHFFQAQLFAPEGKPIFEYLEQRGYTSDEIEDMGLGFFPGMDATREFLRNHGVNILAMADIFSDQSLDGYSIVIPYRDASGRLMGLIGKKAADGDDAYRELTDLHYVQDTPLHIWRARGQKRMVLIDGLFDCLVAERVGIKAPVGISKNGLSAGELDTLLQCGLEHIVLALSTPQAARAAIKLIRENNTGIQISVAELPEGFPDADAFIRANCIHKFGDLINRCVPAQEWLEKQNI